MQIATADLGPAGTLAALEQAVRRRRAAEVDDLLLVLRWADLHSADPADNAGRLPGQVPGGERLTHLGGDGTPGVQELALCELGIARGVHTLSARAVVADALDLRHRLPATLEQVRELRAEAWVARRVAAMSRRLCAEAARVVDAAVAAAIAGQSPGRVLELAAAKVIEADQAAHRARVEEERKRRYVGLTRTDEHGLRTVIARVTAGDAHWVDAMVARVAEILAADPAHRDQSADERRAEAFGWLARPAELLQLLLEHTDHPADEDPAGGRPARPLALPADLLPALRTLDPARLRPRAVVYVHLHEAALTGVATGVARVEGLGPHSLSQVRELLGRADVVVKPVIDLTERVSVCAYEHPEGVGERIHLLHTGDAFPHATATTRKVDLDHPTPFDRDGPPGQTDSHVSQPLGRTGHRAKTHLGYRSRRLDTGEVLWRTPHGLHRVVDAGGTCRISEAEVAGWESADPVDRALTRLWHRHRTGQLSR